MTQDKKTEPAGARVPRGMKIMLGLSLALNLLVVGVVAGAVMRGGGPARGPAVTTYAMPYVRALPGADRRAIFRELRSAEVDGLPDHATRKALYADMIAALGADTFDQATIDAILAQQSTASVAVMKAAQQAWIGRVAKMSNAERHAYAEQVREVLDRRRNHDNKR